MTLDPHIEAQLARVRLAAFDVDGTLTDGSIVYGDGAAGPFEVQRFNVQDGYALTRLKSAGVVLAWITGRGSPATQRRAKELGIDVLVMHAGPKDALLAAIQRDHGIPRAETLAMGDDLPDLLMFAEAGLAACPANAAPQVRAVCPIVSHRDGGHGAVRDVAERILRAKGQWPPAGVGATR